jgi:hypothetical protein
MRSSALSIHATDRRVLPVLALALVASVAMLLPGAGPARGGARVARPAGGQMATNSVVGENRTVTRTVSDGNINRNTNVQTDYGDINRNTNVNTNTGTVNRNTNVNTDYGNVNRNTNVNANTGNVNRNTNVDTDYGSVNRNTNVNVNNGNVNVNRDVDIDVDHGWYDNHPVATAAAVGTAVAVTAAAVGSIVYSLPPSCSVVVENGVQYNYCGGVYYQPMYSGSTVSYVVVNP